jgi:hypothetical protein
MTAAAAKETLFEIPPHRGTGHQCGKCVSAIRPHRYRDDWLYCKAQPCKRTQFGIKRIKSRHAACYRFEPRDAVPCLLVCSAAKTCQRAQHCAYGVPHPRRPHAMPGRCYGHEPLIEGGIYVHYETAEEQDIKGDSHGCQV